MRNFAKFFAKLVFLKKKKLFIGRRVTDVTIYFFFFTEEDGYCYCNDDILGLISAVFECYESSDFMLFLGGSVTGLKAALLKTDSSIAPFQ